MFTFRIAALSVVVLAGCAEQDETAVVEFDDLNAQVYEIVRTSCGAGASPCHGNNPTERALNFETLLAAGSLWDAMANVPSCQYDAMPLVVPGDPDGSWLMVKLTAPVDGEGRLSFEPDPSWVPADESCAVQIAGRYDFGSRMPEIGSLTDDELEIVRAWIVAGAELSSP